MNTTAATKRHQDNLDAARSLHAGQRVMVPRNGREVVGQVRSIEFLVVTVRLVDGPTLEYPAAMVRPMAAFEVV